MRRSLGILTALLLVAAFSTQALAERRRRRPRPAAEEPVPTSPQIAVDMGEVEWGWSHKKLISHHTRELRKMYRPVLAKAGGAIEEDRLRRQMEARISRIRKSYVEFDGQRSGWDASLIRDQYTHHNGEALVEVRELRAGGGTPRYTDYFFFINDRLWKRYRAFSQDAFSGLSFQEASAVFQRRYGKARPLYRTSGGTKSLSGLEWRDEATTLRAVDNSAFYGVLCLVYTEQATEGRLDELRSHRPEKGKRLNPLVEALGDTGEEDIHADVVEHITGKRYKTAQPRPGVKSSGKTPPRSKGRPSGGTIFDDEPRRPSKSSGDLLDDLDI